MSELNRALSGFWSKDPLEVCNGFSLALTEVPKSERDEKEFHIKLEQNYPGLWVLVNLLKNHSSYLPSDQAEKIDFNYGVLSTVFALTYLAELQKDETATKKI